MNTWKRRSRAHNACVDEQTDGHSGRTFLGLAKVVRSSATPESECIAKRLMAWRHLTCTVSIAELSWDNSEPTGEPMQRIGQFVYSNLWWLSLSLNDACVRTNPQPALARSIYIRLPIESFEPVFHISSSTPSVFVGLWAINEYSSRRFGSNLCHEKHHHHTTQRYLMFSRW